jgi:hypothetical protein
MEWTQSGPPRLARVFPCGACLISGFYTHLGHPGAAECPTRTFHDFASHVNSLSSASVPSVARLALRCLLANPRRSHRPKPAFRKVILDGDRRSDGRYLEISCRGQHRSLWQTTRRWPSPRRPLHRPRPCPRTDWGLAATPHSEPDLTPRTSLRAEQRACAPLFQGTSFPHLKWLRLPDQKWL